MKKIITLISLGILSIFICGCTNTGSSTVVGEHFALPELSDAGDNVSVKVYESVKGARVWTAKDCNVTINYNCTTTNSYCGVIETKSNMSLDVIIEPLDMNSSTNSTTTANED